VGQVFLIFEALSSHTDTPHSVVLFLTSDDLGAEISTSQHAAAKIDTHAPGRIRTHNPSKRAGPNPRLRPRDHWVRRTL